LFKDAPTLCGQTCAYLATGRGKELRGLFLGEYMTSKVLELKLTRTDCRQDVTKLLEVGRETLMKENRNTLTVNFIDGYCNEP
jgi:hypothetical protein